MYVFKELVLEGINSFMEKKRRMKIINKEDCKKTQVFVAHLAGALELHIINRL